VIVRVKLLPGGRMPERATAGAAGLDCYAPREGCVHVGGRAVIPLGFALEVPPGWAAHPVSRSGLAKNWGVVEYWGTIDSDYRGEVKAMLFNHGQEAYRWSAGERICQLLFLQVPHVELVEVTELGDTPRGPRGFGSTGDRVIRQDCEKWVPCGLPPIPGFNVPSDYCSPFFGGPSSRGYSGHALSPALRPYQVRDGGSFDGSVGAVVGDAWPCPRCGATFAHAESCPEVAK
jgi:dUTP pyrophosphatase